MKKIMIAVAVAASAVALQAASFSWSCTGGASNGRIYGNDSGDTLYSLVGAATAYLFDAASTSQAALLAGLRGGDAITAFTAADTTTINSSSKIAAKAFDYAATAGNEYTFYFAIVNGDNVYLSQGVAGTALDVGQTTLAFASGTAAASQVFNDVTTAYGGAGWYSTAAAVPEPTSGLLMLLGMAGLALRRRRA